MGAVGGLSQGLGTIASLFSSKMLMKYQYKLARKSRRKAYQDTMFSMREAGLNPILAYQRGAISSAQSLGQTPDFGKIGAAIAQGRQAKASERQATSAEAIRSEQAAQAVAARGYLESQKRGQDLENIITGEQAKWAATPEGKAAIHGKMIGGIWGPPAAGAAMLLRRGLNSAKEIYDDYTKDTLQIYPTQETQKKLDASRAERNK